MNDGKELAAKVFVGIVLVAAAFGVFSFIESLGGIGCTT